MKNRVCDKFNQRKNSVTDSWLIDLRLKQLQYKVYVYLYGKGIDKVYRKFAICYDLGLVV